MNSLPTVKLKRSFAELEDLGTLSLHFHRSAIGGAERCLLLVDSVPQMGVVSPCRRHVAKSAGIFVTYRGVGGCYWPLEGRGQG